MKPAHDVLDSIAAEGAALDLDSQVAPAPGPLPAESNAAEWAKLPAMFGSILCLALPQLQAAYSPENCLAWGRAMDEVARAYGWDVVEIIKKLGPWPALILASLPMALPTLAAIKEARKPVTPIDVTELDAEKKAAAARALAAQPGFLKPVP